MFDIKDPIVQPQIIDKAKEIVRDKFCRWGFTPHQYPNAIGMWPNEQETLVWLALNAPDGNLMEIGSFCGGSAVLLCLARNAHNPPVYGLQTVGLTPNYNRVVSVDINFGGWYKMFDRNVYKVGKFQDIHHKIECCSYNELHHRYTQEVGEPLSFVFIDAWHSFKGAYRDFLEIQPRLTKGAIVAFHDVHPQPYEEGQIDHFYKRALDNYDKWMSEELPKTKPKSTSVYHEIEDQQNFMLDEVVAYIIKEHNYELIDTSPVIDESNHLDRIPGGYTHGTTSPYHGLVAIRKNKL